MKSLFAVAVAMSGGLIAFPIAAQPSPDEVRQLLGHPIDFEKSVVFSASRASLKQICNEDPEFEGHASIIARLEYGSLDEANKAVYKDMTVKQMVSNSSIFEMLDVDGRERSERK